jgi:hypothetical protein
MNTENIQKTNHHEEPLFILKYSWWRILWRLFWPNGFICLFTLFILSRIKKAPSVNPVLWFVGITFGIMFAGSLWLTYDMLGMKGIYLYGDRMIKHCRWGKEKLVLFVKAKYDAMSNLFMKIFRLYDENEFFLLRGFKGIYFDTSLSAPKDVKIFMEILSRHTGRDIEELKSQFFPTKLMKMIKRG